MAPGHPRQAHALELWGAVPEGDTVHKAAAWLRQALLGRRLHRVELLGQTLAPASVEAVEAVGKHTLITLDGRIVRVHLGMHGEWRSFAGVRPGLPPPGGRTPRRGKGHASVVLATEEVTVICHQAREVEVFPASERRRHRVLTRLGPDLLAPEVDPAVVVARARARGTRRPLEEVLVDQQVAAGLGNVYRCELCFLGPLGARGPFRPERGLAPQTPLDQVTDVELAAVYQRGRELLLANLGPWDRTTTFDPRRNRRAPPATPRLWVYARTGQPCLRCRAMVLSRPLGEQARATQWCPRCQG